MVLFFSFIPILLYHIRDFTPVIHLIAFALIDGDVIALSETWNPEYKDNFQPPILPGYNSYKGTKGSSLKGGCGLYISTDLKPLARPALNIRIKK